MTAANANVPALPAGIHDGVSMADYLNHRGFSASKAHTMLRYSPYHAMVGMKGEPSEASETGVAVHDALLEGVDRIVRIDADSWRTKAAKEAREAARAIGDIPLLAHKADAVEAAVKAAKAHIQASPLSGIFERGRPEQTIVWQEGEITCKARPDWLTDGPDRIVLHVKTTKGTAKPEVWSRTQLEPMGYDVADEFYLYGMANFADPTATRSYFLVIEQEYPHGCSLVELHPLMRQIASGKVARAIKTWQQCRASGKYPAYPTSIYQAEARNWQVEEAMERGDLESLSFEERIELGGQA